MKKPKLPGLVTILILSAITVCFWVGLDIYRALTVKPAPPVPAEVLNYLDPNLDEATLNELEQRVYIEPDTINPVPLVPITNEGIVAPTVTPVPIPQTPVPTSEAQVPSPTLSPSP